MKRFDGAHPKCFKSFLARGVLLLATGALAFAPSVAEGAVPQLINFQGVLRDGSGNPVANGAYSVTFTIYDAPSAGTALWTEMTSVNTTNGLFTALLGENNPVPDSVFNDPVRYLGIKVASDSEMTPRQALTSVGYTFRTEQWTSAAQDLFRLNGNVGIGTTAPPEAKLHLKVPSVNDPWIILEDPSGAKAKIKPVFQGLILDSDNKIGLSLTNAVVMTIDNVGVGIGTTSPTRKLQVNGTTKTSVLEFDDGTTQNTAAAGTVGGSGTANSIAKWTGPNTIANSIITETGGQVNVNGPSVWRGDFRLEAGATIKPTGDVVTLSVQKSSGSPTADIIEVTNNTGTITFMWVDDAGVVHWSGTAQGNISGNAATATTATNATNSTQLGGVAAASYARLDAANTFTTGTQTIQTGGDANKGVVIRANSPTQFGKLWELQTSNGTSVASGDPEGRLVCRTVDAAGNISAASVSSFVLDVTTPTASLVAGGSGPLKLSGGGGGGGSITVSGTTSDVTVNGNQTVTGNQQVNGTLGVQTAVAPPFVADFAGQVHATNFVVSSDARFKKNVTPLTKRSGKIEKGSGCEL